MLGTSLLFKSGLRPTARQHQELPPTGVYRASVPASRDPEAFDAMFKRSPRFRGAMQMVASALTHSNLDVLRAYVENLNPGMWLAVSRRTRSPARNEALLELARLSEAFGRHDQLARLIRCLQVDDLSLEGQLKPDLGPRRERLTPLHAVRVALIQRICLLATEIPNFSPQHGVARDDVLASIVGLEVKTAVDCLARLLPVQRPGDREREDFGEESSYRPERKLFICSRA